MGKIAESKVQISLSVDRGLLAQVDKIADSYGISRNALIVSAAAKEVAGIEHTERLERENKERLDEVLRRINEVLDYWLGDDDE